MSISRRQFFRGLVGQNDDRQREQEKRRLAVESYVRTNLLPYDFGLTGEQTAEVLAAAVAGVDITGDSDLFTYEGRMRLSEIVETKVHVWREEYLRAEEVRRDALPIVNEFLLEATPEEMDRIRSRFQMSYPADLNEEIEREARIWLSGLPNALLANCSRGELRELVFSQIRSWC
jgi:hypothetical protein